MIKYDKVVKINMNQQYLVSELKNSMSMAGIFSIFLLVTCVYYLGRIPSPIFSNKLNKLDKMEEEEEFDNNSPIDYMYGDQENLTFVI
jgi:hypothetical protein